ncbi:MAG: hypothetical protein ABSB22_15360 [Thermodesulfobacteriota bacterium]|jgi:hypothetical protein
MVNNCEGCFEKQRKIHQLLEEVQRLKAKLCYQDVDLPPKTGPGDELE